jgi:ethanolamine utilization cobalamin adenosyltransferase
MREFKVLRPDMFMQKREFKVLRRGMFMQKREYKVLRPGMLMQKYVVSSQHFLLIFPLEMCLC